MIDSQQKLVITLKRNNNLMVASTNGKVNHEKQKQNAFDLNY